MAEIYSTLIIIKGDPPTSKRAKTETRVWVNEVDRFTPEALASVLADYTALDDDELRNMFILGYAGYDGKTQEVVDYYIVNDTTPFLRSKIKKLLDATIETVSKRAEIDGSEATKLKEL